MEFTKSLIKGKLIKRYKRFFTDVKLGKEIVTAHCPNTGSMKGLLDEDNDVYILPNNDPKRKLKYGLEIIKTGILLFLTVFPKKSTKEFNQSLFKCFKCFFLGNGKKL